LLTKFRLQKHSMHVANRRIRSAQIAAREMTRNLLAIEIVTAKSAVLQKTITKRCKFSGRVFTERNQCDAHAAICRTAPPIGIIKVQRSSMLSWQTSLELLWVKVKF
jgi:hypothetical protein